MTFVSQPFLRSVAVGFLIFAVLAATPLAWIAQVFALPLTGPWLALLLLFAAGAPLAGFGFVFLFSKSGERLAQIARLAGFWTGAVTGAFSGLWIFGAA